MILKLQNETSMTQKVITVKAFDLNSYMVLKNILINEVLDNIFKDISNDRQLLKAMKYSLMAGGKRIRPVLCIAAAETVSKNPPDVTKAACAIEMIHTYSLIHDDLPAMDNDDLRRGNPTCHIAFDEATAILAGDALLTLAFQLLSGIRPDDCKDLSKWLRVIHSIAVAAGHDGMIEGQMQDISSENKPLDLEALEKMHRLKTGALIEASIRAGGILGNGNDRQIEHLGNYAKNIGLAFQVADDILNVEGDAKVMGKAVGTDKGRSKNTYPSILGLEESKKFAQTLVNNSLQALEYFDTRADPLRAIARYIIERKQ